MQEQPGIVVQHNKVVVFCCLWSRTRRFKAAYSEQLYKKKNEQEHAEPLMQWESALR